MLNCGNFGIIMVHLHELLVQKNVQHMTLYVRSSSFSCSVSLQLQTPKQSISISLCLVYASCDCRNVILLVQLVPRPSLTCLQINMQVFDSRTDVYFKVIQSNRLFVWWICLAVKLSLNNVAIHLDCLHYCLNNKTTYLNQSIVLKLKWCACYTFD